MSNESKNQRDLFKVMSFATALSLGVLAAIVVSMKKFGDGSGGFEFSWKTVAAFVAGLVAGWAFWKVVRRKINNADKE